MLCQILTNHFSMVYRCTYRRGFNMYRILLLVASWHSHQNTYTLHQCSKSFTGSLYTYRLSLRFFSLLSKLSTIVLLFTSKIWSNSTNQCISLGHHTRTYSLVTCEFTLKFYGWHAFSIVVFSVAEATLPAESGLPVLKKLPKIPKTLRKRKTSGLINLVSNFKKSTALWKTDFKISLRSHFTRYIFCNKESS